MGFTRGTAIRESSHHNKTECHSGEGFVVVSWKDKQKKQLQGERTWRRAWSWLIKQSHREYLQNTCVGSRAVRAGCASRWVLSTPAQWGGRDMNSSISIWASFLSFGIIPNGVPFSSSLNFTSTVSKFTAPCWKRFFLNILARVFNWLISSWKSPSLFLR